MTGRWVTTWLAAPQRAEPDNLPPPPFRRDGRVLAGCTLRQTLRVSAGGKRLRLRFSNAFGGTELGLARVAVAAPRGGRAGTAAIEPGTSRPVTFGGRPSVVVPPGAQWVSDPLDFPVAAGGRLAVTVFAPDGQAEAGGVSSHPGSRTTSYLWPGPAEPERFAVTPVDHWYFLSAVEAWSDAVAGAAVVLGDSLTDGRGSTTNGDDRWTDQLAERLRSLGSDGVAVLNAGLGGNRVLRDGAGPGALARLDRDVLAVSGARWLVVFQGVNDIGTAGAAPAACGQVTAALIGAYGQILARARAQGLRVYGATLTPFGGSDPYDDPGGRRESARQAVNAWIRAAGHFDAVVDFDRAVRDPAVPRRLRAAFDAGDHLHLNPVGYAALAAAVPPALFAPRPLPASAKSPGNSQLMILTMIVAMIDPEADQAVGQRYGHVRLLARKPGPWAGGTHRGQQGGALPGGRERGLGGAGHRGNGISPGSGGANGDRACHSA